MRLNLILIALGLAMTSTSLNAGNASKIPPHNEAGGFSERPHYVVKHDPFKVVPLVYKNKDEMGFFESMKLSSANSIAKNDHNLGLLVIKDGKVLHESYNSKYADENSLFFSMSMSKSLTAYSMAGLVCSGKVDISEPVGKYSDELGGTYMTASVRDVLRMASGAPIPTFAGQPVKGIWRDASLQRIGILDTYKDYSNRETKPGTKFNYYAPDTLAIARVIAKASNEPNMMKEFKEQVWNQIGAEKDAAMNHDKHGIVLANSSFSATLRDWGRLGLWSLAKNREDSCEGKFHKEANTQQIVNHSERQGKAFKGYGYQVWIRNDHQYWWVGHGGQRVGVDTEKNAVIVAFSYVEDYMNDLYKLMDSI